MKIQELRQLIREELFSNQRWIQKWSNGGMLGPFDVYKNPPSIKNFKIGTRALTVPNGDLYLIDSPVIIHHDIIEYLNQHEGYNLDPDSSNYYGSGLNKKFIGWAKEEGNILNLSESTNLKYFNKYYETDLNFRKYIEEIQTKHPKIIFELKRIDY